MARWVICGFFLDMLSVHDFLKMQVAYVLRYSCCSANFIRGVIKKAPHKMFHGGAFLIYCYVVGSEPLCAVLVLQPPIDFSAKPSYGSAVAELKLFREVAFLDISVDCGALPPGDVHEFGESDEAIFRFLL